jgi:serine-type D-Ala-D-Ala carboxypeptidase (penicillin-binding protein 5/6)
VVVAFALGLGVWNYFQPVPAVVPSSMMVARYPITGTPPNIPWPNVGSAAVGASGLGLIATSGDPAPAPVASLAKVMTALVLVADKPIGINELGPTLVMTEQDVATYTADAADHQSVVPVAVGERLSEYQALEALLIPSGNNIAETLARWDAGSVAAFVEEMNQRAATLHLTKTNFADPSGISSQTVSTPTDMLALGMAAMRLPVVAQIVGLTQTVLPVAGLVYNVNGALGQSGIIGIKTGFGLNTGADFLFAASADADGQQVTLYGCVIDQPTLAAAFDAAKALIETMQATVKMRALVSRGDTVGAYSPPWGGQAKIVATDGVTFVEWPGMILHTSFESSPLTIDGPVPSGISAGTLHVQLGDQSADVPLVTAGSLDAPGVTWRLTRINW